MNAKNLTLYSLLCLTWGSTWYVIKLGLNGGTPPIFGAGLRFLLAGMILSGIVISQKKELPLNVQALKIYALFGLLNFSFSYGITYWATQFIFSNMSAILWASFPFTVAIIAHLMLPNERITPVKATSISLGTLGIVLIMWEGTLIRDSNALIGIGAIIIAVFISAFPNVYLKKHSGVVNSLQLNTVSQFMAGIVLLVMSLVLEKDVPMVWSPSNILYVFILALFGSVLSWLIYFYLFSFFPVSKFAYVAFIPPVIATGIGWIFLGESLTGRGITGAFLVATGALAINLFQKRIHIRST